MKGKGPNDFNPKLMPLAVIPKEVIEQLFKPSPLFVTLSKGPVSGGEGVQVPFKEETDPMPKPGFQILASSLSGFRILQMAFPNGWMVQVKVPYNPGHYEDALVGAYDPQGKTYEFDEGLKVKKMKPEEVVVFLDRIGGK